jgi:signal transduction histidine kinase
MMVNDLLQKIRPEWIAKLNRRLAKGEGTRLLLRAQLESFFGQLIQAVDSGDPAWMNTILDEWVAARTQTDLENHTNSLMPFLEQILLTSYDIIFETLDRAEALLVIGAILPVFTYSFTYATQKETTLQIEHLFSRLEGARMSLERLDKSKSDFISIAAHELKTPLTLIEGYSAMVRDRLNDCEDTDHIQVMIKGIENGTRRLRQIVDDMIDVSVIDNQMLSLNYQPVWISRLLDMVERECKEILTERGLTLQINRFPGSQEMTFGDEERLYQALRNVVSNGIKYTPDGGSITVDGRTLPGFVEIVISDTGIGIDPEDTTRIFEKFGLIGEASRHSSGKTKFKGGGPGLGLPITKGIIDAHGGTIWAESEGYDEVKCPGSRFHILLPIRKEPPDKKIAQLFRSSVQTGELKDPYR